MAYDKKSLLDNRYHLLATSSIYTYEDENLTSYADFLKKFGRFIGKEGYLDANQTIHRANLRQKQLDRTKKNRSVSPSSSKKINLEFSSAVEVAKHEPERAKRQEKHLKVIEDQMIKSKQDERATKRQEGDVKKERRTINQTMKEFDSGNYTF
jgi:hypothetical protein